MSDFKELVDAIQRGDAAGTENLVKSMLDQGKSPGDVIKNGVVVALDIVGKKFSAGECFIPEMLVAAKASQKGLDILRPLLIKEDYKPIGKVVIGTVKGDLHDIGKNIVSMMLAAAGFEVNDLGVDVFPEKFAETVQQFNPNIVALSCLLTTTMESMRAIVEKLKETGLREKVKVMIGGPPTSDDFARKIGADFYGEDAYKGVEIARRIVAS
jgi:5-methyltetrahydrofolate--homocysteine methyltransferase